ncbi:hypothetical protein [Rickettsiella endosymbiont of Dermanyssus gallinae]|uniref:hypothetical protein n=1 Tax=Rickettsiella endosymbiont of Dermanyssus gallinae TaxID=2856608 RepID=UPI001C532244|nr:hypothetical protein [Rickettsiella endosymbiont of Dermanyssus gallinae]
MTMNVNVNQFWCLEQPARDYLFEIKHLNEHLYRLKHATTKLLFDCHAYFLSYEMLCRLIQKEEFGSIKLIDIKYLYQLFYSQRLDELKLMASDLMPYKERLHKCYQKHFRPVIDEIEKGEVK